MLLHRHSRSAIVSITHTLTCVWKSHYHAVECYSLLLPINTTYGHFCRCDKGNNKITELRTILQRESQNSYVYKQTKSVNNRKTENRNDPDLVQAFLKKWWVESYFKAPNLPLSLRLNSLKILFPNTCSCQHKLVSLIVAPLSIHATDGHLYCCDIDSCI